MVEDKKESKINVEELIIKYIDWTVAKKSRLETKAVGYLAIISLMLPQIFNMMLNENRPQRFLFTVLSSGSFVVGLLTIVVCAIMIFPKEVHNLKPSLLWDTYNKKESVIGSKIDSELIDASIECINNNYKTNMVMTKLNCIASILLMFELILFILTSFIFVF